MFNITFYQNTTENNRLDKTPYLIEKATISGTLREECSIIAPSIIIQSKHLKPHKIVDDTNRVVVSSENQNVVLSDTIVDILNCNYAYIPKFNRYYYITNIISIRTGLWQIEMSCDVLMSFKKDILKLDCYIGRQEFEYDPYLPDDEFPAKIEYNYKTYQIPTELEFKKYDELSYIFDTYIVVNTASVNNNTNIPSVSNYMMTAINFVALQRQLVTVLPAGIGAMFSNPVEAILNVRIFPFNLLKFFTYYGASPLNSINVGSYEVKPQGFECRLMDVSRITKTLFRFNISDYVQFNDFRRYGPYSKYYMNIPFYGTLELDYNLSKNVNYYVDMSIDALSGMCSIFFIRPDEFDNKGINYDYVVSFELGCEIVVDKTSWGNSFLGLVINSIKSLGSALGLQLNKTKSSLIAPQKYSTGTEPPVRKNYQEYLESYNKLDRGEKFINKVTNITVDTVSSFRSNVSVDYNGNVDFSKMNSSNKFYVYVISNNTPDNFDIDSYAHLIGRPAQGKYKLDDLYGYTEVIGVHLENITNATTDELSEIHNLLTSGVLLKDKKPSTN